MPLSLIQISHIGDPHPRPCTACLQCYFALFGVQVSRPRPARLHSHVWHCTLPLAVVYSPTRLCRVARAQTMLGYARPTRPPAYRKRMARARAGTPVAGGTGAPHAQVDIWNGTRPWIRHQRLCPTAHVSCGKRHESSDKRVGQSLKELGALVTSLRRRRRRRRPFGAV